MKQFRFIALLALCAVVVFSLLQLSAQEATEEPETACSPVTEEMATAFLERFNAVFDGPNLDIADEIFAEDFVAHLPLAPELDREGWKDYIAGLYVGMSDLRMEEVNQVIVGKDRLAWQYTFTGTHDGPLFGIPATGNAIVADGTGIVCFGDDGLVIEGWGVFDGFGMLAQIGALSLEE